MKTLTACPICDGQSLIKDQKIALSAPQGEVREPVSFMTAALVRYSLCPQCGAYIQNPRMTDDDIESFYGQGLYRKWLDVTQADQDTDEKRRAQLDATLIKDYIGANVISHLDIGASRGFLLDEVDARIQVAVEPNPDYMQHKKPVVYPDMDIINEQGTRFDLVTAIHSLEHMIDPLMFLASIAPLVTDGGHLVIEVPSENSPGGWARLAHTFHFPTWTLHYIADQIDWKITKIIFTPHLFIIMERK
jgi:SAM-dependent methyltransferase